MLESPAEVTPWGSTLASLSISKAIAELVLEDTSGGEEEEFGGSWIIEAEMDWSRVFLEGEPTDAAECEG